MTTERRRTFDARAAVAPAPAGAPPDLPFEGAAEFADVLRQALRHAREVGARQLCWCDADYATWPLGEPAWIEALTAWVRGGARELVMVADDWTVIERRHPRFVEWRRTWAHATRCLVPDEGRTAPIPTLWVDTADQAIRVFDHEHWRGRAGFGRADRQHAREEFDAIAQRASPGFPAAMLGL